MKRGTHLFYNALGFSVAALLLLGVSFIDFSSPTISTQNILNCQTEIITKQKLIRSTISNINDTNDIYTIEECQLDEDVSLFVFKEDHLLKWANDIPVSENELLRADSIARYSKLGDQWYIIQSFQHLRLNFIATILVRNDYHYTNQYLHNIVNPALHLSGNINIVSAKSTFGHTIYGINDTPLFKIVPGIQESQYTVNITLRWIALVCCLVGIFLFFHYYRHPGLVVPFIFLLATLRIIIFFNTNFFTYNKLELFSPYIYSDSYYFNSLGSLLLDVFFIFLAVALVFQWKQVWATLFQRAPRIRKIMGVFGAILFLSFFASGIHYIIRSLSINSCINLALQSPGKLSVYSIIAYIIISILVSTFLIMLALFLHCCFPIWFRSWRRRAFIFIYALLTPVYAMWAIAHYNAELVQDTSVIWAYKMALQHDPVAEMILRDITPRIVADPIIKTLVQNNNNYPLLSKHLYKYYFNGYLEHYNFEIKIVTENDQQHQKIVEKIEREGNTIDEKSDFYYLDNHNGRSTYLLIIREKKEAGGKIIYVEMNSKVSGNEAGYSELLLRKEIMNIFSLPLNYSFGKYFKEHLIRNGGEYDYPYYLNKNWKFEGVSTIINDDAYTHYLHNIEGYRTIVISHKNDTLLDYAAGISYLFLFFTLCSFMLLYSIGWRFHWNWHKNTLRRNITLHLFSLLIITLCLVGITSVIYSVSQYKDYSRKWIENYTWSTVAALDPFFATLHTEDINHVQDLYPELLRISSELMTDINIYNPEGRLCLSSQPEIFKNGIQSTRMNAKALSQFQQENLPKYIQDEHIGTKSYMSVYIPYYNRSGELIAYLNLPNFINREATTHEIYTIISAYANLYIILMIAAIFMGIALANRMTRPLEIIRRNLQKFNLSYKPEHINYSSNDELGELIKAYNDMISALEESAKQLAQTERESAWREMARQIAHEIKNPLTPMRLSLQHLLRMKKDNAPGWTERFEDVSVTLLEQIDTLAKTASEFSSLAKTNLADHIIVDLNKIMIEQQPLFDNYPNILFTINSDVKEANVKGHLDQIGRVLMNILTNAVQAIDEIENGKIALHLQERENFYCITIEDNGTGIDESAQAKLFVPNFTTKKSGSGLGLYICRNIVEGYGGSITYHHSSMGGACFTVCFPKAS